jgi:hypothetical protein
VANLNADPQTAIFLTGTSEWISYDKRASVQTARVKTSIWDSLRHADLAGLIVGSWLLPSPNCSCSRRRFFSNGLGTMTEVAQEGFQAPLQSTLNKRK